MHNVSRAKKTRRQAYTEQLATRIETIRAGLGIEPKELAKRLKIPFQTYRAYEEGRRMMPPYVMVDLCRLSGHGPWFVLTGEPERDAPVGGPDTSRLKALRL